MTLIRVELLSSDAEVDITVDGRTLRLIGPDHMTLSIDRLADIVSIKPVLLAPNADKHRGVPVTLEPDFPPVPPSPRAGVVNVKPDGSEEYQSIWRGVL